MKKLHTKPGIIHVGLIVLALLGLTAIGTIGSSAEGRKITRKLCGDSTRGICRSINSSSSQPSSAGSSTAFGARGVEGKLERALIAFERDQEYCNSVPGNAICQHLNEKAAEIRSYQYHISQRNNTTPYTLTIQFDPYPNAGQNINCPGVGCGSFVPFDPATARFQTGSSPNGSYNLKLLWSPNPGQSSSSQANIYIWYVGSCPNDYRTRRSIDRGPVYSSQNLRGNGEGALTSFSLPGGFIRGYCIAIRNTSSLPDLSNELIVNLPAVSTYPYDQGTRDLWAWANSYQPPSGGAAIPPYQPPVVIQPIGTPTPVTLSPPTRTVTLGTCSGGISRIKFSWTNTSQLWLDVTSSNNFNSSFGHVKVSGLKSFTWSSAIPITDNATGGNLYPIAGTTYKWQLFDGTNHYSGPNITPVSCTPYTPPRPTTSGSKCGGDVNGDGVVDTTDINTVIKAYGTNDPKYDLNHDGTVSTADVLIVQKHYQQCTPL